MFIVFVFMGFEPATELNNNNNNLPFPITLAIGFLNRFYDQPTVALTD